MERVVIKPKTYDELSAEAERNLKLDQPKSIMKTIRVTTWPQLKQLTTLAQEYSEENKQYDAPFAVYAVELVRRWQLNSHEFYLLYDSNNVVGYTILHGDDTGLNNTLYVYDLFVTKSARGKGAFHKLIELIANKGIGNNFNRAEFPSDIQEDQWQYLTQLRTKTKKILEVYHPEYKE